MLNIDSSQKKSMKVGYALSIILTIMMFITRRGVLEAQDANILVFFVGLAITIVYILGIQADKKLKFRFWKTDKVFLTISLSHFLLLCFILNNTIEIFGYFPTWVMVYLVYFIASFQAFGLIDKLSPNLKNLTYFSIGAGFVFILYFAIYLIPTYGIGLIGLIFLGLTFNLFVPLIIVVSIISIMVKLEKSKKEMMYFLAGLIAPLFITSLFLTKWNSLHTDIHKAHSSIILRPDNTLPTWVLLSQDISTDSFTSDIIKGRYIFDTFGRMWGGNGMNRNFDERRTHDPLVNIGISLFGELNLDIDTRIKLLKSNFNARHQSHRRLWSGRDLSTIDVLNNIKVYPDYRLAYTEKIITIKNSASWESNQQESVYTFHLPEGSVATSLSLWIEGKEEKSRLTTKSKADSAYVSIVGIERRDPALMHWQEGNRLSVTVFPCTPKENRIFKVGITSPLEKEGDKLTLNSIYFEGPFLKNTLETSVIDIVSDNSVEVLNMPRGFNKEIDSKYIYTGEYRNDWELSLKATPLSSSHFSFGEYSYHMVEQKLEWVSEDIQNIYLDMNKSWNESEFNKVIQQARGKNIYVHYDKMIKVDNTNSEEVFDKLSQRNFSLFPFNEIPNPDNSLLITKSEELSPNISDIEDTKFYKNLTSGLQKHESKINILQLGQISSPYLKTLKEYDLFNFYSGSSSDITKILTENIFPKDVLDSNRIDIEMADISILRDTNIVQSKAPDHLLRLFAYSNLMNKYGNDYFNSENKEVEELVSIANEAYIVSPVSSLIVLETIKDYERFGIDENKNSLKNASMKSSGAVPEPHEWVMIGIFGLLLIVVYKKRFMA
ncbi:XrtN system VIT domain-containing protein [Candidatus Kapabacteria bacterium]|nr:XrtN system VIT domain-containing protein [Candidatus Kapabacteria bacterium]